MISRSVRVKEAMPMPVAYKHRAALRESSVFLPLIR